MSVRLLSPVEGKQAGETYTGANEAWHIRHGNAKNISGNANVVPGVLTSADADAHTGGYTYPPGSEQLKKTPSLDNSAYTADPTFDPKAVEHRLGLPATDHNLVPNGHEPNPSIAVTRNFEPQHNADFEANPTEDGVLPEPVDPGVNPHA